MGEFSATWKRLGQETLFGPFSLAREENERVWGLIEQVNFSAFPSSGRMGIPDEILYTFTLLSEDRLHTLILWRGDMPKYPPVQAVVMALNRLIEKYTRQKAQL